MIDYLIQYIVIYDVFFPKFFSTNLSVYIFSRILAIEPNNQWSSMSQIQSHRLIHDRYVIQLRVSATIVRTLHHYYI